MHSESNPYLISVLPVPVRLHCPHIARAVTPLNAHYARIRDMSPIHTVVLTCHTAVTEILVNPASPRALNPIWG